MGNYFFSKKSYVILADALVETRCTLTSANLQIAQWSCITNVTGAIETVDQLEAFTILARIRTAFACLGLTVGASETGQACARVRALSRALVVRYADTVVQTWVVFDAAQI